MNSKNSVNQEENEYAALWILGRRAEFVVQRQEDGGFPLYPLLTKEQVAKKSRQEPWDPLNHLPPPYGQPNQPAQPQAPEDPPVNLTSPLIQEEPEAHRTRGRWEQRGKNDGDDGKMERKNPLYPLREVLMANPGQGPPIGYVSAPLNTGDVRKFKKEMGKLLEDPVGVAERLDQFLGLNTFTWVELQSILVILFTAEEREMINQAGMRIWDREHPGPDRGDQK